MADRAWDIPGRARQVRWRSGAKWQRRVSRETVRKVSSPRASQLTQRPWLRHRLALPKPCRTGLRRAAGRIEVVNVVIETTPSSFTGMGRWAGRDGADWGYRSLER